MKNFYPKGVFSLFLSILLCAFVSNAQDIPNNTVTHTAKNGSRNWSDASSWNGPGVPGRGAIVHIPTGSTITYDVVSNNHIFIIKNEGTFIFKKNSNTKLVVDTFVNTMSSDLQMDMSANSAKNKNLEIIFKAYDLRNDPKPNWNNAAKSKYTDIGKTKNSPINTAKDDGPGVLGRINWDPAQIGLGLISMGKVSMKGYGIKDFSEASSAMGKRSKQIRLKETPTDWKAGDKICISGTPNGRQSEVLTIESISGNTINTVEKAKNAHTPINTYKIGGNSKTNYYAYVGNLTRNITLRSDHTSLEDNVTRRGHVMLMHSTRLSVENVAFVDLGRTDKGKVLDDLKYNYDASNRRNPFSNVGGPANADRIQNQRGRYSFHFHQTLRAPSNPNRQVLCKGSVVWGSPGWGMVHHDSNADFTDNVVFDARGSGMVAESGSELGIWKNNLVVGAQSQKNITVDSPLRRQTREHLDDDFRTGAAYGLQSRAVEMVNNVAAASTVAFHYQSSGEHVEVADEVSTKAVSDKLGFDAFPLEKTVPRSAIPIIKFKGNRSHTCRDAFKSLGRNGRLFHRFHRVLSVIEDFVGVNSNRFGLYIGGNFAYLAKDMVLHSNNSNGTQAMLIGPDNINCSNVTFDNWRVRTLNEPNNGASDSGIPNPDGEFVFNNVKWFNSLNNPYARDTKQVTINEINNGTPRRTTFTPNGNMDTELNFDAGDTKVVVDGRVRDGAGTVEFPNSATRIEPLEFREYDFKNRQKLNEFLSKTGQSLRNVGGNQVFTLTEYFSDRIDGRTYGIDFEITLKSGNSGGGAGTLRDCLRGCNQDFPKGSDRRNCKNACRAQFSKSVNGKDIAEYTFSVFPNPASGVLYIDYPIGTKITIHNALGAVVKQGVIDKNNYNVNTSSFNKGIYFATIEVSEEDIETEKIVIH